jgi:hypothetical protein
MNFKNWEPPRSRTVHPGAAVADGDVDEPSTTMYVTRFRRSLGKHQPVNNAVVKKGKTGVHTHRKRAVSAATVSVGIDSS